MNHLNADEQARVREHPTDFSVRTRNDVADQQDQEPRHFTPEAVALRSAVQGFSKLVHRVQAGQTFIITIRGVEMAQLCPVVPRIDAKGEV